MHHDDDDDDDDDNVYVYALLTINGAKKSRINQQKLNESSGNLIKVI